MATKKHKPGPAKEGKLTPQKIIFCNEYIVDRNGTQAAIRAGYSPDTANEQAARLLATVSVKRFIDERLDLMRQTAEITFERVLMEYARIAFTDIREFYDEYGELLPVHKLSDAAAAAISSIDEEALTVGRGEGKTTIGYTKKIKRWDKNKALDAIREMLGFNAPIKTEVKGTSLTTNLSFEQAYLLKYGKKPNE